MKSVVHIRSHVGVDGTLHVEGLHQIANQDVVVTLAPLELEEATSFDLQRYAAPTLGKPVLEQMKATQEAFSKLPVLDGRSPDEILGYDEMGLPQ